MAKQVKQKVAIDKIESSCGDISRMLRAMSHPQRLMVLCHLREGEKSVSELQELCGVSQSQLSQFLVRMKAEGLIDSRREGQYQIYSITDRRVSRIIEALEGCCVNG